MRKNFVLLLTLIFYSVFGQNSDFKNFKFCKQISAAIKHISTDKTERVKKLNLYDSINNGRNYTNLAKEYVAFKLKSKPKQIFTYSADIIKLHFDKIEKASYKPFRFNCECIKNLPSKPNTFLSKVDDAPSCYKYCQ